GAPGIHRQGICQDGCVRWKTTPLLRDERWNEYSLSEDSQVLRILFKEEESYKIMDEYDDTGQPVYVVEGRTLHSIKSAETQVENS
ncbi:MAG: hypothetical protein OK457_10320, partial [Thaumarchaeota archaeon]|nr:hypothetical protein [Nitrososphaerota archaeon]